VLELSRRRNRIRPFRKETWSHRELRAGQRRCGLLHVQHVQAASLDWYVFSVTIADARDATQGC